MQTTLITILISLSFSLIVLLLIILMMVFKMKKTLKDYTSLMYSIIRKTNALEDTVRDNDEQTQSSLTHITTTSDATVDVVKSLTSSIRSLIKQNQEKALKDQTRVYPNAQMIPIIDEFITEHVLLCAFLIREQRIPDPPAKYITERVSQAYPNIDYDYICERVLYIMDQFNRSTNGTKAQ